MTGCKDERRRPYRLCCQNAGLYAYYIVAYMLKAKIVEPEKQQWLGHGCETRNNGVTVGSSVFCAVRAEAINKGQLPLRDSPETPSYVFMASA
jgi:hypothetical protein